MSCDTVLEGLRVRGLYDKKRPLNDERIRRRSLYVCRKRQSCYESRKGRTKGEVGVGYFYKKINSTDPQRDEDRIWKKVSMRRRRMYNGTKERRWRCFTYTKRFPNPPLCFGSVEDQNQDVVKRGGLCYGFCRHKSLPPSFSPCCTPIILRFYIEFRIGRCSRSWSWIQGMI